MKEARGLYKRRLLLLVNDSPNLLVPKAKPRDTNIISYYYFYSENLINHLLMLFCGMKYIVCSSITLVICLNSDLSCCGMNVIKLGISKLANTYSIVINHGQYITWIINQVIFSNGRNMTVLTGVSVISYQFPP